MTQSESDKINILKGSGALDVKRGSVTIHFNDAGNIAKIQIESVAYPSGHLVAVIHTPSIPKPE